MAGPVLDCPTMASPKLSSAFAQESLWLFMSIATCTDLENRVVKQHETIKQYCNQIKANEVLNSAPHFL